MKIAQTLIAVVVFMCCQLGASPAFATCNPDPCVQSSTSDMFDGIMNTFSEDRVIADGTDFSSAGAESGSGGGLGIDTNDGITGDMWGYARDGFQAGSSDNDGNGSVAQGASMKRLGGEFQAHQHDANCNHEESGMVNLEGYNGAGAAGAGDQTAAVVEGGGDASFGQQVGGPTVARMKEWSTAKSGALTVREDGGPATAGTATATDVEIIFDANTFSQGPRDD